MDYVAVLIHSLCPVTLAVAAHNYVMEPDSSIEDVAASPEYSAILQLDTRKPLKQSCHVQVVEEFHSQQAVHDIGLPSEEV